MAADSERDWLDAHAGGSEKCWTCGVRRPEGEVVACEVAGPGAVNCPHRRVG